MSDVPVDLDDVILQYAEAMGSLIDLEMNISNQRRLLMEMKATLTSPEGDGGFALELTAHAFKQISERLESIAIENPAIYLDALNPNEPYKSLLLPSNLKSFIVSVLAKARKDKSYVKEKSRQGGQEFRYTVRMEKWSSDRDLEFVGIVENNVVKTGFFNWI
jgi:hypothetical protein